MSTICTCDNSGKTTGFACNYSPGCPFSQDAPKTIIPNEQRELEHISGRCTGRFFDPKSHMCAWDKSQMPCTKIGCIYPKCMDQNPFGDPDLESVVQDVVDKAIRKADQQVRDAANVGDQAKAIADKVAIIHAEYTKATATALPVTSKGWLRVLAIDKDSLVQLVATCDRRVIIELPNGDELRIVYNNQYQAVEIIKVTDRADGAINIMPGSTNQIFIK